VETTAFTTSFDLEGFEARRAERWAEDARREEELAALSAHLNAATARFLELAWEFGERVNSDDLAGWVGFRFGVTRREAREYLRVAEALRELPVIRAAFARGALSFTKVRALTRVATPSSEERLLEVAESLTASQLERALRVYRRIAVEQARETHELEFVSYSFEPDGSLYLQARLAAEDGTLVIKALDAARERVLERRRAERAAAAEPDSSLSVPVEERPAQVEALLELADTSLAASDRERVERTRVVVHVDAAALSLDPPRFVTAGRSAGLQDVTRWRRTGRWPGRRRSGTERTVRVKAPPGAATRTGSGLASPDGRPAPRRSVDPGSARMRRGARSSRTAGSSHPRPPGGSGATRRSWRRSSGTGCR